MSLTRNTESRAAEAVEPQPPVNRAVPSTTPRNEPFRRWVRRAVIGDWAAAAIAAFTALHLRFGWDDSTQPWVTSGDLMISYQAIGLLVVATWPLLLAISGAYELKSSLFGVEELRRILRAGLLLLGCAGLAHIALRLNLSRGYFLTLLPLTVALTALARAVVSKLMGKDQEDLRNHHRVVVVGPTQDIALFVADLDRTKTRSRVEVVGYVADDVEPDAPAPAELTRLRRVLSRDDIRTLTDHDVTVDLLVRAGRPGPDEMWALSQRAHDLGVTVAIAPHRHDATSTVAMSYVPLGSTPLLMVETPTLRPVAVWTKAIFDRVVALAMLVALAPVFAVIAAAIALRDGRPIFFRQTRVGHLGQHFGCWKFRTMVPDAEARLTDLQHANEADGLLFKMKDDPRVTSTGRFLRRHSLDELPQLLNVLKGDMSIVGPRPPLPSEVEAYDTRTHRRLNVKPGCTGLWQTQGRSDLPWDDGIYLDLMYIDHWSPLLDLVIMARTVRSVLKPDGAY
ncbi:sugar transferase [Acidimicrobiia bacterium EGI L10123]|uniref:sugar transferase n=1 Tax=Salinilacustrithrix flava TaxID=2957203 RepID=UPI003D7C1931|nr:sugar transferase [Acidimicrobiia bacterium EGI L10123]